MIHWPATVNLKMWHLQKWKISEMYVNPAKIKVHAVCTFQCKAWFLLSTTTYVFDVVKAHCYANESNWGTS